MGIAYVNEPMTVLAAGMVPIAKARIEQAVV
jgi:hypothetical protein